MLVFGHGQDAGVERQPAELAIEERARRGVEGFDANEVTVDADRLAGRQGL